MAKAKISKEKEVEKSLKAAAKILNKKLHKSAFSNLDGNNNGVTPLVLYQVWCPDTEEVIGEPTTDEKVAKRIRNRHNLVEGHNARVIPSN